MKCHTVIKYNAVKTMNWQQRIKTISMPVGYINAEIYFPTRIMH